MAEVICDALQGIDEQKVSYGIRATRHLWREQQRQKYIPLLRRLLRTASLDTRKAALERLLEKASTLEFEQEKRRLVPTLEAIVDQPEFAKYQQQIRQRLSAELLTPVPDSNAAAPENTEGR